MNYIKDLQHQIESKDAYLKAMEDGMVELSSYLLSPKFYEDTTVQVKDVLHRLGEIQSNALDAQWKALNVQSR